MIQRSQKRDDRERLVLDIRSLRADVRDVDHLHGVRSSYDLQMYAQYDRSVVLQLTSIPRFVVDSLHVPPE